MSEQTQPVGFADLEAANARLAEAAGQAAASSAFAAELGRRLDDLTKTEPRPGLPVEHRAAQVADVDFAERVITFIAVPYEQETVVPGPDGAPIRELVEASAFKGVRGDDNPVTINREHDYGRTVGKAIRFDTSDDRGLIVDAQISRTPLGDETLQLAADGVLRASVGMMFRRSDAPIRSNLRRIKRALLDHIALLPNPAYAGAAVLSVKAETKSEQPASTPNLDAVLELLGDDWR